MAKKIDLTGQQFGMLTVLSESTYKNNTGKARWLCQCDCGDKTIVSGHNLRNGNTTSCGCKVKENARKYYQKKKLDSQSRKRYSSVIRSSYI